MKKILFPILALMLAACGAAGPEAQSSIDAHLQDTIATILTSQLEELGAAGGEVIIMETNTGRVVAHVAEGLDKPGTDVEQHNPDGMYEPGSLMRGATILACLQSGKVNPGTIVDTYNGVCCANDSLRIRDSNWRRGGHGAISTMEVGSVASNIGCFLLYDLAFGDVAKFSAALRNIHFGDSLKNSDKVIPACDFKGREEMSYGYGLRMAPLQLLTFYNTVANNGRMLHPLYTNSEPVVMAESIADSVHVSALQNIMRECAINGTASNLKGDSTKVSALTSTAQLYPNEEDSLSLCRLHLCGYFPNDKPRYTILVTLHKSAPAYSGVHCTPLFFAVKKVLE